MKIYSLLKAVFSQDMNLFKVSINNDSSKLKKIIVPFILFCFVIYAIGVYAYGIIQILIPINMKHVLLTLFIIACTVISFVQGVYKSQGILFDSKDNDILLSLPIKKSHILFIRVLKLLIFQYLFSLMFLLPAFAVYAYYASVDSVYYIMSIIMSVLVPIIPTVCGSIIGYLIKLISSRFKKKKIIQSILSIIITFGIFLSLANINGFINEFVTKVEIVNKSIIRLYYPIELYLSLITNFNLIDFILLLIINMIPLAVFVLIGAKYYYKIISKMSESDIYNISSYRNDKLVHKKPIISLTLKEIKRYFSSPIYVFNTLFGPVIIFIFTIFLCIKGYDIFNDAGLPFLIGIDKYLPVIYYALVLAICGLTQITASSISIEGKTINITKSLPISGKMIFDSKIIMSFIIQLPFVIISNILFIIKFRVNLIYTLLIFGVSFIAPFFISCLGLIINLKYPKMDASNDTEIVKQSMSSAIAIFAGMIFMVISTGIVVFLNKYIIIELALFLHLVLVLALGSICYVYLVKKGANMYRKINV